MRTQTGERIPGGRFRFAHFRHDPRTGLILPQPYKVIEGDNAFVNSGVIMLNLFIGAGGTVYNNANAFIGVGDSSTATTATMTDLQATLAATIAISSSTNASPIVLTTSAAHGLTAGQTITVAGHLVNTAANGTWIITVPSGTTIGLTGSTGVGVGAATGTVAQGNRMRVAMDATFPSLSGQVMTWQCTLNPGVAEWGTGIQEGALFNGFVAATSTLFARIAQNAGIKAASTTLKIQYSCHIP